MGKLSAQAIITIIVSLTAGIFTTLTYAHSTFVTLREADSIIQHLTRIERKLDDVLSSK